MDDWISVRNRCWWRAGGLVGWWREGWVEGGGLVEGWWLVEGGLSRGATGARHHPEPQPGADSLQGRWVRWAGAR